MQENINEVSEEHEIDKNDEEDFLDKQTQKLTGKIWDGIEVNRKHTRIPLFLNNFIGFRANLITNLVTFLRKAGLRRRGPSSWFLTM